MGFLQPSCALLLRILTNKTQSLIAINEKEIRFKGWIVFKSGLKGSQTNDLMCYKISL